MPTVFSLTSDKCIDLLKLDCEGSEYEILKQDLGTVRQISGEFHIIKDRPMDITDSLEKNNFRIEEWRMFPLGNAGIFWAKNNKFND